MWCISRFGTEKQQTEVATWVTGVQALLRVSGDGINGCGAWGVIQFPSTDTITAFSYPVGTHYYMRGCQASDSSLQIMGEDFNTCALFKWQLMAKQRPSQYLLARHLHLGNCLSSGGFIQVVQGHLSALCRVLGCTAQPRGSGFCHSGFSADLSCPEAVAGGQAHISNPE